MDVIKLNAALAMCQAADVDDARARLVFQFIDQMPCQREMT